MASTRSEEEEEEEEEEDEEEEDDEEEEEEEASFLTEDIFVFVGGAVRAGTVLYQLDIKIIIWISYKLIWIDIQHLYFQYSMDLSSSSSLDCLKKTPLKN